MAEPTGRDHGLVQSEANRFQEGYAGSAGLLTSRDAQCGSPGEEKEWAPRLLDERIDVLSILEDEIERVFISVFSSICWTFFVPVPWTKTGETGETYLSTPLSSPGIWPSWWIVAGYCTSSNASSTWTTPWPRQTSRKATLSLLAAAMAGLDGAPGCRKARCICR